MPVVNIEGVGRVHFPEGMPPDQIKFAIENDILPRMAAKAPSTRSPEEVMFRQKIRSETAPTGRERLGRGVADVTQGATQVGLRIKDLATGSDEYAPYTAEKTEEEARYEANLAPDGIDAARLVGNVGMTLPAMLIPGGGAARLGPRIASGAAQGAAASGAMFTPEDGSGGGQATIGGLVGGAVPVVGRGLRQAGGKIRELLTPGTSAASAAQQQGIVAELASKLQKEGVDWGKLTSEVQASLAADAQKALSVGGTLDDAMLANKALIEQVGAKPTRASITRAPKDWQQEANLRGGPGGEAIMQRHRDNALAMTDYLQKLRSQGGGKTATALEAGESVIGVLKSQDAAKENAVSGLYDAYRAAGGEYTRVPQTKLTEALGKVIDDGLFDALQKDAPGVVTRLKEFGFLEGKVTRNLTVKDADLFNRVLNNNNPGFGPASKAIATIKSALNESLLDVPESGLKSSEALVTARKAAAERFADQRAGKGITAALDEAAPDRFVKKFFFDADVRDVRAMKAELLKTPDGAQAMKDVKGHLLDTALLKATNSNSLDDLAFKVANKEARFSGAVFGKWLDSIPPEKLHLILSPDEIGALRTLQRASKDLTEEVAFSDVNHSHTTAALAELMKKIGNTPFLGSLLSMTRLAFKAGKTLYDDQNARKQVAELLVGSAAKAGAPLPLPAQGMLGRAAPAAAGSAAAGLNQESERGND